MQSFKLVVPAQEDIPRKLRIALPGRDNIEVEIQFETANNRRVVKVELDSEATTTLNESNDRATELLSQIDIDSSGGFIPPDIARELDEGDADDVVEASQCEEDEEPIESVIPGLYSPPRSEARDHLLESSFDDDCFVPATQQRKHGKDDSDDDADAVVLSSDEEPEEEVNPELTTVRRDESRSPSGPNRRRSSREESPPKVVAIAGDSDEDPEPRKETRAEAKNAESDSGESFAGEPMMPDSQPVEPIVRKKFIKKRNVVVLSSDDEEDAPREEVSKSLPDLETEPPAARDESAENLNSSRGSIAKDKSPKPASPDNAANEILERSVDESPAQDGLPGSRNASPGGDRGVALPGTKNCDEDAEILTGMQIVDDTQNQTSPKPKTSKVDQNLSDEKLEIPETEEQRNFKTPNPVDKRPISSPDTRTQESLRLTLLSESNGAGTPSQTQAPERPINRAVSPVESNQDEVPDSSAAAPNDQQSSSPGTSQPNIPDIDIDPKRSRNSFLDELGRKEEIRDDLNPPFEERSSEKLSYDPDCVYLGYPGDQALTYLEAGGDLALTDCPASEYIFLRAYQQYPSVATRRQRVENWLAQTPGGVNEEYAHEMAGPCGLEAMLASFTDVVEPISPIIKTAGGRSERKAIAAAAGGPATPSRKRSFPGPSMGSPEKRHRNIVLTSPNQRSPPTATGAEVPESKSPKGSSVQATAGGDGNLQGNRKDDEVTELVTTGSAKKLTRVDNRRRRLYNSQEEATQHMSKIVDSQEVENFALPPASRTSERTPRTTTRKSTRKAEADGKPVTPRSRPTGGAARPTRRTRSSRSEETDKDAGLVVRVETRSRATPSRTSGRSMAASRNSAKTKAPEDPQQEVLVAETAPEERVIEQPGMEATEVEETPAQSSSESLPKRRALRPRTTKSSESRKTDLPDPYAKETIEVDPPAATRTRSTSKKSGSSEGESAIHVDFSEEISAQPLEPRPLRSRQQPAPPGVRATRVRSLSNLVEKEQSVPKRSRLIQKSSSSITVSLRNGCENERAEAIGGDDPNLSINGSIASSDSSLGVSRMAKARVMFTGIENPPREEVLKLGLKVTDIISQCNVVVAAKFTRTVKMMYAVAKGIPVVSSGWIMESCKAKKVLGIENFMLRDEAAEKKYNFSLVNTLRLANETKFFKGWNFYVTKSCSPNAEQLGEMISGCDAKVLARIPMKFVENTVIVTCVADRKLLPKKPPVPVVSVEFVFHGILQHEVDFETFEVK